MLRAFAVLSLLAIGGCDFALTMAQTAGQAGLDHTIGGYMHRTVSEPMPVVRRAVRRALANMAIKVNKAHTNKAGFHVDAEARNRSISVNLEPLSKRATLLKVVVSEDVVAKDSATANEIIDQTMHAMNVYKAQAMLKRLGYRPGGVDGVLGNQTRDAIEAFQRRNRLARDGEVSPDLISSLERSRRRR